MSVWKEFRAFAFKSSALDLAIGFILGAAFATVVKSLVDDVLMPVVAAIIRVPDFRNLFVTLRNPTGATFTSVEAARQAGLPVLAYGVFINAVIAFLTVAIALFFVVKAVNRLRSRQPAAAEAPPAAAPSAEVRLLTEIRDQLALQRA